MSLHNLTHEHLELAKQDVGVVWACRWRLPWASFKLWYAPAGTYEGYQFLLVDTEEAQAVLTSDTGDEALNAIAGLRGDFEVVVEDEAADGTD